MEDRDVLDCIRALSADRRRVRDGIDRGDISAEGAAERLLEIDRTMEQMWVLLRERRARGTGGRARVPGRRVPDLVG